MNTLIQYPVPDWVVVVFLIFIPLPVILTILLGGSAFEKPKSAKVRWSLLLFFGAYLSYVTFMGFSGKYNQVFFPPKVLLFTTFPFAFFLFLYLDKTKIFREFLFNVKLENLVVVHIFRIIGGFFILLAFYDALPKWFAFIAGTGDILSAVSSIWVAKKIKEKNPDFKKITLIWNTFGLIDILFTAVSANVITKISIDQGIMGVDTLAHFPFYYIPAIAPPLIVFLHFMTYKKLKMIS